MRSSLLRFLLLCQFSESTKSHFKTDYLRTLDKDTSHICLGVSISLPRGWHLIFARRGDEADREFVEYTGNASCH